MSCGGYGIEIVTGESGSNDGERPSANGEASHDVLGDTQLGRSLKELIKEIGREKDALQKGLAGVDAPGMDPQDADAFDPSESRFDQDLEQAVATQRGGESSDEENSSKSKDVPVPPGPSSSAPSSGDVDVDPA